MEGFDGIERGYEWLLKDDVVARYIAPDNGAPDRVLVTDAGLLNAAILMVTEVPGTDGEMTVMVNGELLDFGDDFPCVLGLIDAAREKPGEEVYIASEA